MGFGGGAGGGALERVLWEYRSSVVISNPQRQASIALNLFVEFFMVVLLGKTYIHPIWTDKSIRLTIPGRNSIFSRGYR